MQKLSFIHLEYDHVQRTGQVGITNLRYHVWVRYVYAAVESVVCRVELLKVGFHYPSSRPEFTGRVDGPRTRVHFLTPVNSGRELG